MKLSDDTSVALPIRNLLAIVGGVAIAVWAYFGIIERLNKLETADQLQQQDLLAASTQRPVDQEQYMLLEYTAKQLEKHQEQLDNNVHTGVMLKQFEKEIEKLKHDVEKLKDAQREIKFSNGNGVH
jgi:septal ring factor EnvC (AmiA/AmiB activator)